MSDHEKFHARCERAARAASVPNPHGLERALTRVERALFDAAYFGELAREEPAAIIKPAEPINPYVVLVRKGRAS